MRKEMAPKTGPCLAAMAFVVCIAFRSPAAAETPTAPTDSSPPPSTPPTGAQLTPRNVQTGPAAPGPSWLAGSLVLVPRGIFIVNSAWNSGTMTPGSFVFYALPRAVSRSLVQETTRPAAGPEPG